jgi:hypothetical protein
MTIEVRCLRQRAGLSAAEAARRLLGTDPANLEQIEHADGRVSRLLRLLPDELGIQDEDYGRYFLGLLVDERERPCDQQRGWTQTFWTWLVDSAPPYRRMYLSLGAETKRMYQPAITPGVLQTATTPPGSPRTCCAWVSRSWPRRSRRG